jgi:acyl carrier protein
MLSMEATVLTALATSCNVDPAVLARDTSLIDLGFDSLSASVFASEIERALEISLEPEDIAKLYAVVTPADVFDLMGKVLQKARNEGAVAAS